MYPVLIISVFVLIIFIKTIKIVPNQNAFVVERLGKYHKTLYAGLHILIPFLDKVSYKHMLKEQAIDVRPQVCITKDNISVEIDGVLYLRITDPVKASYGISNWKFAISQLSQTTMRSEIGKIDMEATFESRDTINSQIVNAVDLASDPWGIQVTRYEIKNIDPPESIKGAMEKQMRAEREKRSQILLSEGEKESKINRADADRQQAIKISEGERERLQNESTGQASAIEAIAKATALGIREIAGAMAGPGGKEAVSMQIAQEWIKAFSLLAKENNTMIVPTNLTDITSVTSIIKNAANFGSAPQDK